jgi:hypothetical protein
LLQDFTTALCFSKASRNYLSIFLLFFSFFLKDSNRRSDTLESSLIDPAARTHHAASERELDVRVMELLDIRTLGVSSLHGGSLNNGDAAMTDTMTRTHFLVELFNGTVKGDIAVLLVSVVDTSTGVVTNPNAKVLNSSGVLLEDFIDSQNLTIGLLYTPQFPQEIPVKSWLGRIGLISFRWCSG